MDIPLEPDVSDVPRLMARDALQQAGYTVVSTAYRDNVIAIQGLVQGHVDVALLSIPAVLAAIQQGAGIAVIMGGGSHTRCLVTAPELTACSDLHGRKVSVPNLVSSQTLALQRYVANQCPGTRVEPIVISGAGNRLAALLARRTDGAILDLMTLLQVQQADGPAFNVLSEFGDEFPGLGGAALVASRAFLDSHPGAARDIVRECLLATRRIQDPAVLKARIVTHLGLAPGRAERAARAYLDQKVWGVNGGLQAESMQRNIEFCVEMGVIKPGMTPAAVEDRRYLDAALAEIGRQ
jgi:ABC-type nitrate/sulfonate/bicarbonate transport system substrate-binding protein